MHKVDIIHGSKSVALPDKPYRSDMNKFSVFFETPVCEKMFQLPAVVKCLCSYYSSSKIHNVPKQLESLLLFRIPEGSFLIVQ